MDNYTAVSSLCTTIASSYYPDEAAVRTVCFLLGIETAAEAVPTDPMIFRAAARLVRGYVESSRSEGGVSVSVRDEAINKSLAAWCRTYGLDPDVELADTQRTISNGSNLW